MRMRFELPQRKNSFKKDFIYHYVMKHLKLFFYAESLNSSRKNEKTSNDRHFLIIRGFL